MTEVILSPEERVKRRLQMPLLMTLSMGCFALYACFASLIMIAFIQVYRQPEQAAKLTEVSPNLLRYLVVLALAIGVSGAMAAAIIYGMWCERPWSRDLVILWAAVGVGLAALGGALQSGFSLNVLSNRYSRYHPGTCLVVLLSESQRTSVLRGA